VSQIPVQIKLSFNQTVAVYQKLASKIKELNALGMPNNEIAKKLKISKKTVKKGLAHN
jgi:DNA-binding NarL/FixJ family response regulator